MTPRFDDLIVTRWGARFRGVTMPCAIGRGGIGEKTGEGDGITPVGIFQLEEIHQRTGRIDFNAPHVPQHSIGLGDIWSDDPKDPRYNHGFHGPSHRFSHEKQFRADPLYDAFGVLNFNWPVATAGAGSAIFLHIWPKDMHFGGFGNFQRHIRGGNQRQRAAFAQARAD